MEPPQTGTAAILTIDRPSPGDLVVSLNGEVDASVADRLQEEVLAAIPVPGNRVVVDLSDVVFMDSAGIRVLMAVRRRCADDGDRIRIVLPTRAGVRRTLEIAGLHRLFAIAPDLQAALAESGAASTLR